MNPRYPFDAIIACVGFEMDVRPFLEGKIPLQTVYGGKYPLLNDDFSAHLGNEIPSRKRNTLTASSLATSTTSKDRVRTTSGDNSGSSSSRGGSLTNARESLREKREGGSETFRKTAGPAVPLYFAGTLGHGLDFQKSAGGFIHGFRYSARVLFKLLKERRDAGPEDRGGGQEAEWSQRQEKTGSRVVPTTREDGMLFLTREWLHSSFTSQNVTEIARRLIGTSINRIHNHGMYDDKHRVM